MTNIKELNFKRLKLAVLKSVKKDVEKNNKALVEQEEQQEAEIRINRALKNVT